jgi:predicted methyltransferase
VSQGVTPLLTSAVHKALLAARSAGTAVIQCSLDLGRTMTTVRVGADAWVWNDRAFPYLPVCKDRTVYHWAAQEFQPVARYASSLIKLVPTSWGPPTFEIDGIKMLPTARVSPYADAERKVALIEPRGKVILDTCGGLGYFAAWCLRGPAALVHSCEKNPDVIWLRTLNPWSPDSPWSDPCGPALQLTLGDITERIAGFGNGSVDAILHDPPRFGLAGELYSQAFYQQLARVLRRRGRLFHYTGAPNSVSRGRDLAHEVTSRLQRAGFSTELHGAGVLAVR